MEEKASRRSRAESAKWQHWYQRPEWKRLRSRRLRHDKKMCQCPHCKGKGLPANVVDHIKPHKGNWALFIRWDNTQSMNKVCHDKHKQAQEKGGRGFDVGCDETGQPLNLEHSWYASQEQ